MSSKMLKIWSLLFAIGFVCLILFLLMALASCHQRVRVADTPVQDVVPGKVISSGMSAWPVSGWDLAYDQIIFSAVLTSGLVVVEAGKMSPLCPKWVGLDNSKRAEMWSELIKAVAYAESGWDRSSIYNETGIVSNGKQVIDEVTGMPIISEGLLQLSYADQRSYPQSLKLGCSFDWQVDQAGFREDYRLFADLHKQSVKARHVERTILDPKINLICGVHIMNTIMARTKKSDVREALGSYWSTMRPNGSAYRETVFPMFKKAFPGCF